MASDGFALPRWLRWAAVVLVAAGIFYGSVLAPPVAGAPERGPFGVFGLDKWFHAVGYAALAGAFAVALASDFEAALAAALAVLFAAGYGVSIEFAQASIPARTFSVADMAANAVGAFVGTAVWRAGIEFAGQLLPGIGRNWRRKGS